MPVKQQFQEFFKSTDAHGWHRIVDSKSSTLRRLFWLVSCLACTCFLIYFTEQRIFQYYEYPVQTNFEQQIASQVPMAAVTVCNKNDVSLDKYSTSDWIRGFDGANRGKMLKQRDRPGMEKIIKTLDYLNNKGDLGNVTRTSTFDYRAWIEQNGYSADDIIKSCIFEGNSCRTTKHLSMNQTRLVFPYGKCFTVNERDDAKLQVRRPGGGLKMTVNLDSDNFNVVRIQDIIQRHSYESVSAMLPNTRPSLFISIHHPSVEPDFVIGQTIPVYADDRVDVGINKIVKIRRLPKPYQSCVTGFKYGDCLKRCAYHKAEVKLSPGCVPYDVPGDPESYSICNQVPYPPAGLFVSIINAFIECLENKVCEHSCEEVTYNYQVTRDKADYDKKTDEEECLDGDQDYTYDYYDYGNYLNYGEQEPSTLYVSLIEKNGNNTKQIVEDENGSRSVNNDTTDGNGTNETTSNKCSPKSNELSSKAYITVKFSQLLIETITYEPRYNINNLIAEIGGMSGLFIGMSVLTIAHFVEYLIMSCVRCCSCRGKGAKQEQKNRDQNSPKMPDKEDIYVAQHQNIQYL